MGNFMLLVSLLVFIGVAEAQSKAKPEYRCKAERVSRLAIVPGDPPSFEGRSGTSPSQWVIQDEKAVLNGETGGMPCRYLADVVVCAKGGVQPRLTINRENHTFHYYSAKRSKGLQVFTAVGQCAVGTL